ncbi:GDP-mannose transporter [Xylogone sp. PMI_703]|nr:GDP-mannose transporter [Xylogone sp. PMI_703]
MDVPYIKIEDDVECVPETDTNLEYEEGAGVTSPSPGSLHKPRLWDRMARVINIVSKLDNNASVSALAYFMSSISLTVVNIYVVSSSSWNLNFLYLAIQSMICTTALIICNRVGLIKGLTTWDPEKAKTWFPISILLIGMIYTCANALQFLSVPVYTIFRNLSIVVAAYGEILWFTGRATALTLLSFALMILSSIVASWSEIRDAINTADHPVKTVVAVSNLHEGYIWIILNVICTASFLLSISKVIKTMDLRDWDTIFYNNLLTIPVLVVLSFLIEDWSSENLAKNFPTESRSSLIIGTIYSGIAAVTISYCSAWCLRLTSSTTYSMVGALNKLPIALSGFIFFDAAITVTSVSAVVIGFISGLVYAWAQVQQSEKSKMTLPSTDEPNEHQSAG